MTDDTTPKPSIPTLETEVTLTRAQLAATTDELVARLDPRAQVGQARDGAKRIVRDAVGTDPAADPTARNRSRAVLAGAAAAVALGITLLVRRR